MLNLDKPLTIAVVKQVVDSHDPLRLLSTGCPPDEYDPETEEIVSALEREGPCSAEGLARIVRFVFFRAFQVWSHDDLPDLQYYMEIGKDLWEALPAEYRA